MGDGFISNFKLGSEPRFATSLLPQIVPFFYNEQRNTLFHLFNIIVLNE